MADPLPAQAPQVLVVEDERAILNLMRISLRSLGVVVWEAASGEEGVEVFLQHGSAIKLAILNVSLPGMDGTQTALELRRIRPEVKVCFITGDPGSPRMAAIATLGPVSVIEKPFYPGDLAREIKRLLGPTNE
jgi:two-component system, cell cycle sensor histidine kinase and response regulator CckA